MAKNLWCQRVVSEPIAVVVRCLAPVVDGAQECPRHEQEALQAQAGAVDGPIWPTATESELAAYWAQQPRAL